MEPDRIPLFPLRTVLFPDGPLPLRVFESRYLDMVSHCLRNDAPFGVLLIAEGSEAGIAQTVDVGTLARITDWYQGSDGILGVTAIGTHRFRLTGARRQDDGLYLGETEPMPPEPPMTVPAEYEGMVALLEAILEDLGKLYDDLEKRYNDATWVGCRFAEILPIAAEQKQHCLELNDPLERLAYLQPLLRSIREESSQ